jgi:putative membrane protein
MRLVIAFLVLIFVVFGALFGALNSERITIDLYFAQPSVPKGAILLCAVGVGWLFGGLVAWFARVPRLRRDLRATQRELKRARAEPQPPSDGQIGDA